MDTEERFEQHDRPNKEELDKALEKVKEYVGPDEMSDFIIKAALGRFHILQTREEFLKDKQKKHDLLMHIKHWETDSELFRYRYAYDGEIYSLQHAYKIETHPKYSLHRKHRLKT